MRGWRFGPLVVGVACDPGMEFLDRRVEAITDSSAMVRFETSRATSCAVEYGLDAGNLDGYAEDPTMDESNPFSVDHEVPLVGLVSDARYMWRAVVVDPNGRTYESDVLTFATLPASDLGVNVAGDAVVVGVSSNFGDAANGEAWGADAAIDGDAATEWSSDGDGDDAWIEVEWATAVTLSGARVRSRKMADGTSIVTSFTLSDGSSTFGPFDLPDPDVAEGFTFDDPITTDRLRFDVETSTGGNTGLRELELFVGP